MLGLGLACSGCAASGSLGSLFGSQNDEAKAFAKAETTGSIATPVSNVRSRTGLPPEADLAYARVAVADVLERGGKTESAAWENPRTGARGTVTPIASPYVQDGVTCHDFLASYLHSGSEAWLQGEACRVERGQWEVRTIRPWKRS